jgi:hypothetical protein
MDVWTLAAEAVPTPKPTAGWLIVAFLVFLVGRRVWEESNGLVLLVVLAGVALVAYGGIEHYGVVDQTAPAMQKTARDAADLITPDRLKLLLGALGLWFILDLKKSGGRGRSNGKGR